ncbi:hypothetical protein AB0L40_13995 [Patulibacter sp. NPDC049589]|uniref:hypothetical protein n=1 Tax=Patulibacter sp. NPDC049589 TaxID=3154731 RepID=UPI00342C4126
MPIRRVLAAGLVAGLAVGGLTVGSALADEAPASDPDASVLVESPAQPAPIGAVQPAQQQTLRVLRRARRASDTLPASARSVASPARYGRNPQLARAVTTRSGKAWVVPGDGVVCLVMPDPVDGWATSCAPTGEVATRGLTLGLTGTDASAAVTLVPDGATVTTTDDADRTRNVTPDDSGIVDTDAEKVQSLEVTTPEGQATTEMQSTEDLGTGDTP